MSIDEINARVRALLDEHNSPWTLPSLNDLNGACNELFKDLLKKQKETGEPIKIYLNE